jgi:hypothetical protein
MFAFLIMAVFDVLLAIGIITGNGPWCRDA